ncbi:MAG: DEAD/DEAH box helicase, partial [Deltaproteobacteria bacterium]
MFHKNKEKKLKSGHKNISVGRKKEHRTKQSEGNKTIPIKADHTLESVFNNIGKPSVQDFIPDEFQLKAIEAIRNGDCLVTAPTGSGKTWIAQEAIGQVFAKGQNAWYASPLKALTNAKWVEFRDHFGDSNVGIVTGDIKENTQAPLIVGTTEILRNCLYDAMKEGTEIGFDLVILDEAHYLGNSDRGVVWEEILIYLPSRVNILLLSATIGNGKEICSWLEKIRNKVCSLVVDNKRPVPLYPLFFHPATRQLLPFAKDGNINESVKSFSVAKRGKRLPPVGVDTIVEALRTYNLLPAIFFMKSRLTCDKAMEFCNNGNNIKHDKQFDLDIEELLLSYPYLKKHKHLSYLKDLRLASHHGGHLPLWKFCVETMMKKGHLDAIFATTTVAAGVNYPARTVVITDSDLFDGNKFNPLTTSEFQQMAGRAGRRSVDKIGFVLIVPGSFMNVEHLSSLLDSKPTDIISQIKNNFSMCLNLISSHKIKDIEDIFKNSFATFQKQGDFQTIWLDFLRHLDFLKQEGFVDQNNCLTAIGQVAGKLRVDEPLLFAQAIRENVFLRANEKIMAGLVASYVFDGDEDIAFNQNDIPRALKSAFYHSQKVLKPLLINMNKSGFAYGKQYIGIAVAVHLWASGYDWKNIIKETGFAEGDMVSLILRVAEHLRQLANIEEYPEISAKAWDARTAILREPVLFN